jgi:hypothetical protein
MKYFFITCLLFIALKPVFAQQATEGGGANQMRIYEDSLNHLGKKFINDENELERKNANYAFIKTLVSALKIPGSFHYPFDSVKSINITNAPDNRFRIFSWPVLSDDGSYRFYGAIQINTGGSLQLFPLNDRSPEINNPEDSVTTNLKWFGAEYYKIIPVYSPKFYYVLLGWKGNTDKSTKKVIEILTFKDDKPVFGLPVFDGNGKTRKRVVFEYTRQASMLLRYEPNQNMIVFDHLAPPDPKFKSQKDTYGPDLTFDAYKFKNGRWVYIENLDMKNAPDIHDNEYTDPKKQAALDRGGAKN